MIRKRGDFLAIRENNSWEELSINDPSPRNTVSWKLSALLGTIRYKITRSIRHCSWSNLCAMGGPAITDTKRTMIVRRLIQSVVSVISRVWFIWDRGRGRIAIASNENNTKNGCETCFLRGSFVHNEISLRNREFERKERKENSLLEEERRSVGNVGGNRSADTSKGRARKTNVGDTRFQPWQSVCSGTRFHGAGRDRFLVVAFLAQLLMRAAPRIRQRGKEE